MMLDCIIERTNKYIDDMPKKDRKNMVSFLQAKKQRVLWLDYILIPENISKVRHFRCGSRFRYIVVCTFRTIGTDAFCSDNRINLL